MESVHESSTTKPSGREPGQHFSTMLFLERDACSSFMQLAPECRNIIYDMLFEFPLPYFIVAVGGLSPKFRLRERSDASQYDAVTALRALELVSREIRHEARTFFYATKHFLVLPYGYEYLPVFVRWLESIGPECRAVLRTLCLPGYMWYMPTAVRSQYFQDMLQTCISLQTLVVQLNIWHLCELHGQELDEYLSFEGPAPHDGPMPEIDVAAWARTVASMPKLQTMRLDIIMSVDRAREKCRRTREYIYFMDERGRALANNIERRLREELEVSSRGAGVVVNVRFVGTNERVYHGRPW